MSFVVKKPRRQVTIQGSPVLMMNEKFVAEMMRGVSFIVNEPDHTTKNGIFIRGEKVKVGMTRQQVGQHVKAGRDSAKKIADYYRALTKATIESEYADPGGILVDEVKRFGTSITAKD